MALEGSMDEEASSPDEPKALSPEELDKRLQELRQSSAHSQARAEAGRLANPRRGGGRRHRKTPKKNQGKFHGIKKHAFDRMLAELDDMEQ